jgi:hypothetical protein
MLNNKENKKSSFSPTTITTTWSSKKQKNNSSFVDNKNNAHNTNNTIKKIEKNKNTTRHSYSGVQNSNSEHASNNTRHSNSNNITTNSNSSIFQFPFENSYKTPWTDDELLKLRQAVSKYGDNMTGIMNDSVYKNCFSGRSSHAIEAKINRLNISLPRASSLSIFDSNKSNNINTNDNINNKNNSNNNNNKTDDCDNSEPKVSSMFKKFHETVLNRSKSQINK